jgi:hypothetical protein
MNEAALELELAKARDLLDHTYIRRGRSLGDLSDADLRVAYVRGQVMYLHCRADSGCWKTQTASCEYAGLSRRGGRRA